MTNAECHKMPKSAVFGGKIIKNIHSAPLMVQYQEFCVSSTGPAQRYQIHMLTGSYSLFRNWLIGNEDSYWLLQILWYGPISLDLNYVSKLLSSTL